METNWFSIFPQTFLLFLVVLLNCNNWIVCHFLCVYTNIHKICVCRRAYVCVYVSVCMRTHANTWACERVRMLPVVRITKTSDEILWWWIAESSCCKYFVNFPFNSFRLVVFDFWHYQFINWCQKSKHWYHFRIPEPRMDASVMISCKHFISNKFHEGHQNR